MSVGRIINLLVVLLLTCGVASAQQKSRSAHDKELYALARTDLKAFAEQVSKNATSELGRAQAIVRWLAENFEWKATDYQKRTVKEIIEREGGNCNELAMVALAAIKELNIPLRRVHEINIHTNTPERGETARAKVKEKGNTLSVFGRRHNDHIWLELYDSTAKEWFPADPSSGLVGLDEWIKARVGFGKRFTLNPITEDMIVPFAVFAADADGKFTINRTQHYMIEEFDRLYAGALHSQPAWKKWTSTIDLLDDKVAGAFAGKINLHEYEAEIDSLATTYEELRAAFQNKPPSDTVAFVNVDVIPMDKERVLRRQTVIVRNGVIVEIGDTRRIKVPPRAQKIDGAGKFLIPGLMDMHVHLFTDDEFPDRLAEDEFKIMIAHGVTTIRLMIGTPEQLVLRGKSAREEILAPTIYAASPHLTGRKQPNAYVVTTELEARAAVRKSKQDGYDFIKVTTFLKPEVYEAIVDEARKQNIRVVGHADSRSVGLARALKAGQQIEHLDSYLEALLPESSPVKGSVSDIYLYNPKNWESLDYIDESKIPEIARLTVQSNPFVTPTLHLFKFTFGKGRSEESFKAQPDIRFYPQKIVDLWMGVSKKYLATAAPIEKREKYISIRNKIVKAIYDAGGHLMAGSDTPEWLLLYGYTLHLELVDLRDAGLSNYAALEAATRNPAMFFGTLDKTGTIEKGKRADLVLLEANPLIDIANTQKRAGVMLKGKYYPQAEMNQWLDQIAPRFQHALDEQK